jgi:hypothetical protein
MKDIHKNPVLYYIAIPVLIGIWPLLVWGVYLPNAHKELQQNMTTYENDAEPVMMEILNLDPGRLDSTDPNENAAEFTYDSVVDRIASSCGIPPSKCELDARPVQESSGQKTQNANVTLSQIDITTFARFLSTIQMRWPNLQCTKIVITQKPGLPDMWDFNLDFKYYY